MADGLSKSRLPLGGTGGEVQNHYGVREIHFESECLVSEQPVYVKPDESAVKALFLLRANVGERIVPLRLNNLNHRDIASESRLDRGSGRHRLPIKGGLAGEDSWEYGNRVGQARPYELLANRLKPVPNGVPISK